MTDYRRNFIAGGSFFFTVNLAERRLRLLTQHVDELRDGFRKGSTHPTGYGLWPIPDIGLLNARALPGNS